MAVIPQIDDAQEIRQVYQAMVQIYGREIFQEKRRAVGCMLDMAPRLTKEADYLETALKNRIPEMLQAAKSKKEQEESAKKSIALLEKSGVPSENAMNIVDSFCTVYGIKVSLVPDYTGGEQIPLEPVTGNSIFEAMNCLNHVRWFLNHQEEYEWYSGKEALTELRKLMSNTRKNREQIIRKYKDIVRGFRNNPYEESIIAWEAKENWNFVSDIFDHYFIVIGDMPVTVGFAKQYQSNETAAAFKSWDVKKKAFLEQVSKLKKSIPAGSSADMALANRLRKKGRSYILWCLIFLGILGYISREWIGILSVLPFIELVEISQFDIPWVMEILKTLGVNVEMTSYLIVCGLCAVLLLSCAIIFLSILIVLKNNRKLKKASGPSKKASKAIKVIQEEIPRKTEELYAAMQKNWSSSSQKLKLQRKDYIGEITVVTQPGFTAMRNPVPKLGKLARIILILCIIFSLTIGENIFYNAVDGMYTLQSILPASEADSADDGTAVSRRISGLYENPSVDFTNLNKINVVYATQSSLVSSGTSDYSANSVIDGNVETSWQEGVSGSGTGERIRLDFDGTYAVEYLKLKLGNWRSADYFVQNNRPMMLSFQFGDEILYYEFPDEQREFVLQLLEPISSVNVEIAIQEVYAGTNWNDTCITEVEVYGNPAGDEAIAANTGMAGEASRETAESASVVSASSEEEIKMELLPGDPDAPMVTYTDIPVIAANATSTISQSGVDNSPMVIFDGDETTSWQEGVSGYGVGESVSYSFDKSYAVKFVGFKLGNWKSDDYYLGNGKPKTMTIVIGDYTGQVTFTGEKRIEWIAFTPKVRGDSMRIIIDDVYAGTKWEDTCISEIYIYGD